MVPICNVRVLFCTRLRRLTSLFILAAEALDASGGVDQLLFAGEKRVAVGADFQMNIALMRGSGGKRVPAGTHDADFVVCGMDFFFHLGSSFESPGHTEPLREFSGKLQFKGISPDSANPPKSRQRQEYAWLTIQGDAVKKGRIGDWFSDWG